MHVVVGSDDLLNDSAWCSITRQTTTKIPITERVPFLQRWFAVTRIFLKSKHDKIGYDARWSLYPI